MNAKILEDLIQPVDFYKQGLEERFVELITKKFDALVEESGVDKEENDRLAKKLESLKQEKSSTDKRLKKFKTISTLLKVLIGIVLILGAVNGFLPITQGNAQASSVIILIVSILLIAGLIFLLFKKINPIIENQQSASAQGQSAIDECIQDMYFQMHLLNTLFDGHVTKETLREVIPLIEIDENFNNSRLEQLQSHYGLYDNHHFEDYSTKDAISGSILGNPFIIFEFKEMELRDVTYKGHKTIFWTETYYDSEGKRQTRSRSQTLTATVTAPKPFYEEEILLAFGNQAAPDLNFKREPGHVHELSPKQIASKVKSKSKQIKKMEQRSIKMNESFTPMENLEFESLFNALDRDNEIQYRLLFTPLAQENMVKTLTESLYGDDFFYNKNGMLNIITPEHGKDWDLDMRREKYQHYNFEQARKTFIGANLDYFRHFYNIFLPVLSIPLFQQNKTHEYIYKHSYSTNFNGFEGEVLANALDANLFCHEDTCTDVILKANPLLKKGKTDIVEILAKSFNSITRVAQVPVYGDDGFYHDVPVEWIEYIPLSKLSRMEMKELGLSDREFDQLYASERLETLNLQNRAHVYKHDILAYPLDGSHQSDSDSLIDQVIMKIKGE